MNSISKIGLAAALASALLLGACGGGNSDDTPAPVVDATEVPQSAAASSSAFVGYVRGLGASDETTEPLTIKDAFAVPADDTGEPIPLG